MATLPALTAPPPPPSRSDDSDTFVAKADAFVAWYLTHVTEMNAVITAIPDIVMAANYNSVSTTSLAIATGSKAFTVETGKLFQLGQFVIAASTANPANYMAGQVTSYDGETGALVVNIGSTGGSGTHADWQVSVTVADYLDPVAPIAISASGADLVDASVPLVKLTVAVGSSKLLGSGVGGAGASYVEIALGTNLSMTGNTLNVSSGTATLGNGDYGDVTVSGGGTVITVDAGAVTFAKIQNLAADSIFGNPTGSPAAGTNITCTAAGRALIDDADAAAQRATLGCGTIATVDKATTAQFWNNTSGKALTTDVVWDAAAFVSLAQAATLAVDMSTGFNFTTTMTGNRTLGNPSNPKVGQSGIIEIVQDTAGARTLGFASNWKFDSGTKPTLSTAANAKNYLWYQVISPTFILAGLMAKAAS